jgi:hypothetical protein
MGQWDLDFMGMEAPAFIAFDSDGRGEFHFGCVHCSMHHRPAKRDGKAAVEWSFAGHDEGDPSNGRGMRWDIHNAEAMMALAALEHSNLWNPYWDQQRQTAA